MERSELINTVSKLVSDHWNNTSSPLLIADIPTKIKEEKAIDYKIILGDERLKAFAIDTQGSDKYKVVMHPTQIAKIGLVPYNEEFSFDTESEKTEIVQKNNSSNNSRNATLSFLEAINKLPLKEKMSIEIPAYVLAKLISK